MHKNVLLLCNDNSALSIMAEAVLEKNLPGIEVFSAALKKVKPLKSDVKQALQKDGSWSEKYHAKEFESVANKNFDLVIVLSDIATKLIPEFDENTTVIQIEYEEPDYRNSTNSARFLKTLKMELIPLTRDVLEL